MTRLIDRSFVVEAPLERAWHHLAQVEQWPSWAKHIRSVELLPPGELGPDSSGVLHLTTGMKSEFRMTVYAPFTAWSWTGPFLWMTINYDHRFRAIDDGNTELTFVVDGSGFGAGLFGRLFAAVYNRNLDRAIPNLIAEMASLAEI